MLLELPSVPVEPAVPLRMGTVSERRFLITTEATPAPYLLSLVTVATEEICRQVTSSPWCSALERGPVESPFMLVLAWMP